MFKATVLFTGSSFPSSVFRMKEYEEQSEHQYKDFGMPEKRGPNAERQAILENNKRIRIEQPQVKLDSMKAMCSIPPLDWAILKVRFPELISPDHEIKKQAWITFYRHPVSEPYRVTPSGYKL